MKKILFLITFLSMNFLLAQGVGVEVIDREFDEAEKLFFQKKYNFSREAFLLYLKKRPLSKNDKLYYYIGSCYFQDKQYDEAIKYYKIAFDLNDTFLYCNTIANSYYQLKNYNDAIIWYQRSIERTYSIYKPEIVSSNETIESYYETAITNIRYLGKSYISNEINDENIASFFSASPIFENEITTNTMSNVIKYTNTTVLFSDNSLVKFVPSYITNQTANTNEPPTLIPVTNIVISTNIITNGVETLTETNIYTLSSAYTRAFYYSAYLHTGHSYLSMDDATNAAIYYEIFLKNVGDDYYQKASLESVISLIRTNDTTTNFMYFGTNSKESSREIILPDDTKIKESIDLDGAYRKEIVYTNGNVINYIEYKDKTIIKELVSPDGYKIKESINPYKEREVNITFVDGGKLYEKYFANGSKSILSKKDDRINEYMEYADATFFNKSIVSNENENILTIKKADNSIMTRSVISNENIYYSKSPEGNEVRKTQKEDGTVITETSRMEGDIFVKTENIDNTISILASYNDGKIANITTDTNGITTTKITYPNGKTETRITKDINNPSYNYEYKADDGSSVVKTFYADGSSKVITRKPDGLNLLEEVTADGIITTTIKKPDQTIIKREENIDGSVVITTTLPNKTIITEKQEADGSVETETKLKDGTTSTTIKDSNDVITTITKGEKGETIKRVTLPDGSTKNITELLNGAVITVETFGTVKITTLETRDGYKLTITEESGYDTTASITKNEGPITKAEAEVLIQQFPELRVRIEIINNLVEEVIENTTDATPPPPQASPAQYE